jgi:hypothetical protein
MGEAKRRKTHSQGCECCAAKRGIKSLGRRGQKKEEEDRISFRKMKADEAAQKELERMRNMVAGQRAL